MSDKEEDTPPPAEGEAESKEKPTPSEGGGGGGGRNKNGRGRRDRIPPEEEYDLSKPIPRVPKPNNNEHEKELAELDEEIEKIKVERNKLQKQIDNIYDNNKKGGIGKVKEELSQLRKEKGRLIGEKRSIQDKYHQTKDQADKIMKDKNATKQGVRFTSLADIEAELKRLQRRQETTSMSLSEEKKLIREIDALKKSRQSVAQLNDKETAFEDMREQRKKIGASIAAKDKEIDEVARQIDEKQAAMTKLIEKESDKRDHTETIVKKRDEAREKINNKIKEKDELRSQFRKKEDAWYSYQRAIKAQQKIQFEERKKKEEEERQAFLKKKEEEEAKKIPYEEEQALCDYLSEYLTRTYLGGSANKGEEKKSDVVAVKDDPFSGMKAMVKKNDEEEVYFGKGKGKKKRVRNTKKQDKLAGPFTLSVDTFEQFGWIGLTPPTSVDMVEKSVQELKEKKEWYKAQPRGSVPSASDIRKANEKATKTKDAKNGKNVSSSKSSSTRGKGGAKSGGFSLSKDDFAPLTGTGTSPAAPFNSSWGGKNSVGGSSPSSDEPKKTTPEEKPEEKTESAESTEAEVAA